MRYKELFEDSRAYLYHNTRIDKLDTILRQDVLPATWEHELPNGKLAKGSSLSRNPKLGRRSWNTPFGPVQLVLDQEKLRQNYKIIPLDAENALQKQIDPDRLNDPRWRKRYNDRILRAKEQPFAEEFVIGDVKPLSKYLVKIIFVQDNDVGYNHFNKFAEDIRLIRQYAKEHGIKFVDANKKNQKQFTMDRNKGRVEPVKKKPAKGGVNY